jgi:hypothetical protein
MDAFCSTRSTLTRQAERGLVQQEQPRPEHEPAGHGQHLLLAARERASDLSLPLGQNREILVDPGKLVHESAGAAADVGAEPEVFFHGELGKRATPLGNMRHAQARDIFRRAAVDALAGEADLTRRLDHAGDGPQRGGLAGAVGAQDGGDSAFLDGEVQSVKHLGTSVRALEVPGFQ